MNIQEIFKNSKKYNLWLVLIALVSLVYLLINALRLGGDNFIISLNRLSSIPPVISLVVVSWILWKQTPLRSSNRPLWLGLAIGWGLWTIAESWFAIADLLGTELPYPSWADIFWLVGYLPMFFALGLRNRMLAITESRSQKTVKWLLVFLVIGFAVIFLTPLIQDFDPGAPFESILNILYPVQDIILLGFVVQALASTQKSNYGTGWIFIGLGFLMITVSDFVFSYAVGADLYYPNNQLNFVSIFLVDAVYNLGYVASLIGLLLILRVQSEYSPLPYEYKQLGLIPNTHLVVFTDENNRITRASQNFSAVFGDGFVDRDLGEVFASPPGEMERFLAEIRKNKLLAEQEIHIRTLEGEKAAGFSAILIEIPGSPAAGLIGLVRLFWDDFTLDAQMDSYDRDIQDSLLVKTHTLEKEDKQYRNFISDYYLAFSRPLFNMLLEEGGGIMVDSLVMELEAVSRENACQLLIQTGHTFDLQTSSRQDYARCFPLLFEVIRATSTRILGSTRVEKALQQVFTEIEPEIHTAIEKFGMKPVRLID